LIGEIGLHSGGVQIRFQEGKEFKDVAHGRQWSRHEAGHVKDGTFDTIMNVFQLLQRRNGGLAVMCPDEVLLKI
jgi:hypothetical protein